MTGSCLEYYAIRAGDWQQDGRMECMRHRLDVCKTQMCMCLSLIRSTKTLTKLIIPKTTFSSNTINRFYMV